MIHIRFKLSALNVTPIQAENLLEELRLIARQEYFYAVDPRQTVVGPDDIENEKRRFPHHFFRHLSPVQRIGFDAWITRDVAMNVSLFKYPMFQGRLVPWFTMQTVKLPTSLPDELYMYRHVSVINVLDEALKLGFRLQVNDQTDFWTHRSIYKMMEIKRLMQKLTTQKDVIG